MRFSARLLLASCALAVTGAAIPAQAAVTPAIQLSPSNAVPSCVTPDRLLAFLKKRHQGLSQRFESVAEEYKRHGEDLGVRWDYAFFQMIVETNYLKFKKSSGRWGDVRPHQNNFAGLGATGNGEPGEKFSSVGKGVRAHLQHILMYSGKRISKPVAKRTKLVQDWLLPWARGFNRPVTYTDLTKKWSPTDRGYSNDIESVAVRFRQQYCANEPLVSDNNDVQQTASLSKGTLSLQDVANLGAKPICRVWTARFDKGATGLLIRYKREKMVHYTALEVQKGLETAQADAYIARYAPGGKPIGQFADHSTALNKAFELCPTG